MVFKRSSTMTMSGVFGESLRTLSRELSCKCVNQLSCIFLFVCIVLSPCTLRSSFAVMSTMRSWRAVYSPLNAGQPFNMCAVDSNCLLLCNKQNGSWWFGNHSERLYWVGSACSLALITNLRMPALTAGFWSAECETAGSAHCRHASLPWRRKFGEGYVPNCL